MSKSSDYYIRYLNRKVEAVEKALRDASKCAEFYGSRPVLHPENPIMFLHYRREVELIRRRNVGLMEDLQDVACCLILENIRPGLVM